MLVSRRARRFFFFAGRRGTFLLGDVLGRGGDVNASPSSGDSTGADAPFGMSVSLRASLPDIERRWICGGDFSAARRNASVPELETSAAQNRAGRKSGRGTALRRGAATGPQATCRSRRPFRSRSRAPAHLPSVPGDLRSTSSGAFRRLIQIGRRRGARHQRRQHDQQRLKGCRLDFAAIIWRRARRRCQF